MVDVMSLGPTQPCFSPDESIHTGLRRTRMLFNVLKSRLAAVGMATLAILAAPNVYMRNRKHAERKKVVYDLHPRLEPFVRLLPRRSADPKLIQLADDVAEICEQLAALENPHDVDRAIVEAARAALERFGFPKPRGGWDRYVGR